MNTRMTIYPAATLPGIHCEQCGAPDPQTDDGYTTCCNEPTCWGGQPNERWAVGHFGENPNTDARVQTGEIRACCVAAAERKLAGTGLDVLHRISG